MSVVFSGLRNFIIKLGFGCSIFGGDFFFFFHHLGTFNCCSVIINLFSCRPLLCVVCVGVHRDLGEERRVSENQKSNVVYKDIGASLPVRGSCPGTEVSVSVSSLQHRETHQQLQRGAYEAVVEEPAAGGDVGVRGLSVSSVLFMFD